MSWSFDCLTSEVTLIPWSALKKGFDCLIWLLDSILILVHMTWSTHTHKYVPVPVDSQNTTYSLHPLQSEVSPSPLPPILATRDDSPLDHSLSTHTHTLFPLPSWVRPPPSPIHRGWRSTLAPRPWSCGTTWWTLYCPSSVICDRELATDHTLPQQATPLITWNLIGSNISNLIGWF